MEKRNSVKLRKVADVTIDRAALAEMRKLALTGTSFSIAHLTYEEIQQVLVIDSLIKLLKSYNLDSPFALKVVPEPEPILPPKPKRRGWR